MIWTPERIALARAELASWKGVAHRDRVAVRGVAIDCINLVKEVLIAAGIIPRLPLPTYSTQDGQFTVSDALKNSLMAALYCEEVPVSEMTFGDIAVFRTGQRSGHAGFCAPPHIWHALARQCVTESDIKLWRRDIQTLIRLTGEGFKLSPVEAYKS